ncbi:MAG: hypothetical protein JNN01_14600 [Opitutaceae bacterium]|nr:hypothetical protein [Opitutaceae bacterium]
MTTKVLVSLGSTLSALLAMGGGVEAYQRSQREREEAQRATVVAMEHFEQTIGRARSSIQQSSELRTELIQKTDLLLKDVANTENELVQHGAQVVALNERREVAQVRLNRYLAEARSAVGQATDAVGRCRTILLEDKLSNERKADVEANVRTMTKDVREIHERLRQLEGLGARCDALADRLLVYNESHRASLDRLRQIRQETQEKLDQQKVRQAATEEVGERLKRLQSELSSDLKALRPDP